MTEVEVNNADGSPVCHDCPVCPAGKAPSHRCGEKISPEDLKNLHCSDCAPGKTYSSTEDTSPCHECFETCPKDQVVIQNCSLTADMKCDVVKCDQGFYHDNSTGDCQECSWCCGDGRDDQKAECTERGMPKERSCSVHQTFRCHPDTPKPPTVAPTTPRSASTDTKMPPSHKAIVTELMPTTVTSSTARLTGQSSSTESRGKPVTHEAVAVLIALLLGGAAVFVFVVVFWKCCNRQTARFRVTSNEIEQGNAQVIRRLRDARQDIPLHRKYSLRWVEILKVL